MKLFSSLIFVLLGSVHTVLASPPPMEPAQRTLFVFVHGINPKCSGSEENITDNNDHKSKKCEDDNEDSKTGPFCIDRKDLLGRAAQVWVKNLSSNRDQSSLFCTLNQSLFAHDQFSLRSFTDPGKSPTELKSELGNRGWSKTISGTYNVVDIPAGTVNEYSETKSLRSHAVDAMLRYVNKRRDQASKSLMQFRTSFEAKLLEIYPGTDPIVNLRSIFETMPDSIPSRMIVFAHSMGGLTTREYLMSDVYNDDVDKVVTFDSPHEGSWVAHYNRGSSASWPVTLTEPAVKMFLSANLLMFTNSITDYLALYYAYSSVSHLGPNFATQFSGLIANDFVGDEPGNVYLTPGSSGLAALNSKEKLQCEISGCVAPRFIVNSMDGGLAPDDPAKLMAGSTLSKLIPLDLAREMQAVVMAHGRNWPSTQSEADILRNSLIAGNFAQGNWNYTQHGSLLVPHSSSIAGSVPFLNRPDVVVGQHEVTYSHGSMIGSTGSLITVATDASGLMYAVGTGSGMSLALTNISYAMDIVTAGSPIWWGLYTSKLGIVSSFAGVVGGIKNVAGMGAFAAYAAIAAPSHNASIWNSATSPMNFEISRADHSRKKHEIRLIEADLYEAPFAHVKANGVDVPDAQDPLKSKKLFKLHFNAGNAFDEAASIEDLVTVSNEVLAPIKYSQRGWEDRWAMRVESHPDALQGDGETKVRKVARFNLPLELLTTKDLASLDLQIDDLRPDLMEQMSISINWGLQSIVWDRDDDGTFTVTKLENGNVSTTTPPRSRQPNPIDAYGNWHVDLLEWLSKPVLRDGQNLIAIALTNHVGKTRVQRQYVTWQATPVVVDMRFPQPWEVVSKADPVLDARLSFLDYTRMQFEASQTGWKVESGDPLAHEATRDRFQSIPGLANGSGDFTLTQSLSAALGANVADGPYGLSFQLGTYLITNPGSVTKSYRRIPFTLDRTAPVLQLQGPSEVQPSGRAIPFGLSWTDLPASQVPTLQLVRARIKDANGSVIAELAPHAIVSGGQLPLRWDGRASTGQWAQDGTYSLEIEACDAAVPDAVVRNQILSLRSSLRQEAQQWGGTLGQTLQSSWNTLRQRSDLNWSHTSVSFRLDGTAPRAVLGALPAEPIGKSGLFQIALAMADAGSTLPGDAVQVRLDFRPLGTTTEPPQVIDFSFNALSPTLAAAPTWQIGEHDEGLGRLPDGEWAVTFTATDAAGNRMSQELASTLVVDRAAPVVRSIRADHLMVSSQSQPTGRAVVSVPDATSVTAYWKAPDGTEVAAVMTYADGIWTTSYPADLTQRKGAWTLVATATDAAGNSTTTSTVLWVDLTPPRLFLLDRNVNGPVVIQGIAGDVHVDRQTFESYSLSWREVGATEWRTDGLRVPAGRGPRSTPWVSNKAQTVEGVLGFWTPPPGVAGMVEIRVVVDDGTAQLAGHEAMQTAYVGSPIEPGFAVRPSIGTLASAVQSPLGFDISSSSNRTTRYHAQATLTDAQGAFLFGEDLVELQASRFDGTPAGTVSGALQVWRDNQWHLRANRLCRAFTVRILARSNSPIALTCPTGWTCDQNATTPISLPPDAGGFVVDRTMTFEIPAASAGEVSLALDQPAQMLLLGATTGANCSVVGSSCGITMPASPDGALWPLPMSGEVVTGQENQASCDAQGMILLDPGHTTWRGKWNGFRQDGTYAAPGVSTLDVVAWDASSGRIVSASQTAQIAQDQAVLHAWSDGEIGVSAAAPTIQQSSALRFTLEGRGANLDLVITKDATVVRRLPGDGTWFEGRPFTRPYSVAWDGRDAAGMPVEPGEYLFQVSEKDGTASSQAVVVVSGTSWEEDPTLALNLPESQWNAELGASLIQPKPWLGLTTGIQANHIQGGPFTYQANWSAQQLVSLYPQKRFSLMVNRQRDRIKFGMLFHGVSEEQEAFDTDQDMTCHDGNRTNLHGAADGAEDYTDVQIVEVERGQSAVVSPTFHVHPDQGSATYEFKLNRFQTVEYLVVPLSQVEQIRQQTQGRDQWRFAEQFYLTRGSFAIKQNLVSQPNCQFFPLNCPLATSVVPIFGSTEAVATTTLNEWVTPQAPLGCGDVLKSFGDMAHQGTQNWNPQGAEPCNRIDATQLNVEAVNPHRNLFRYRLTDRNGGAGRLRWQDRDVTNDCHNNEHANAYTVRMELDVPQAYWEPEAGINNLANRYLRFDSENAFLFGENGYLRALDPRSEDALDGHITPMESRTFRWRPRLTNIMPYFVPCPKTEYALAGGGNPTPPASEGWRYLETVNCGNGNMVFCGRYSRVVTGSCPASGWNDRDGTSYHDQSLPSADVANKDPFLFFEGDHSMADEHLTAWFENSPELGAASFTATITQGEMSMTLNSASNRDDNKASFLLKRGSGTGEVINGVPSWTPAVLDVQVSTQGTMDDLTKLEEYVQWPIRLEDFPTVARAAEATCASKLVDNSVTGCKLYKGASGIRFGIGDGLGPTLAGYSSLAQQQYFENRKLGIASDPDAVPASASNGTAAISYSAELISDASGAASYVDQANFRIPGSVSPDWGHLVAMAVRPSLVNAPGVTVVERTDGSVEFRDDRSTPWTFSSDPRSNGANSIASQQLWSDGERSQSWSLLKLYRDAVGQGVVTDQSLALFRQDGSDWSANPALIGVSLTSPAIHWRDGSNASSVFEIAPSLTNTTSGWPSGLTVTRKPGTWGLPELFPVRGYVPSGQAYSLGWMGQDGGWTVALRSTSTCEASDASAGSCLLGMVDASRLPASGYLGVVVDGASKRFGLRPFFRGRAVEPGASEEVSSLFGEASVTFGPEAMAGKSLQERLVTVRTLNPADAGMAYAGNLRITGPVVEVLPSQSFSEQEAEQPRVVVRLSRQDLQPGQDVTNLALYKVDPAKGTLVPLVTQVRPLCAGVLCSSNPDIVELSAATASFSMFAAMPRGLVDSRIWSLSASPLRAEQEIRTISVTGLEAADLAWFLGASAEWRDTQGNGTATPVTLGWNATGQRTVALPVGRTWLFAVPRQGGLVKSISLERFEDASAFEYTGPANVVVGTVNGELRLPYRSNRSGQVSLSLGYGSHTSFASNEMLAPEGVLTLPGESFGHRWTGSMASQLTSTIAQGESRTIQGPMLVGDAILPWVTLTPTIVREGGQWKVTALAQGGDEDGGLDRLAITFQDWTGRELSATRVQDNQASLTLEIADESLPGATLRILAEARDKGGNHVESWQTVDFASVAAQSVWWTEAEKLVGRDATYPVCELPSRAAVRTEEVNLLRWPLPPANGLFLLAGRYRSAEEALVAVRLQGQEIGRLVLPPRPIWGAVEILDPSLRIVARGGDVLELEMPAGMQWDGFALVDGPDRLAQWSAPQIPAQERVQVWVRDEAPADANMAHPRFYVQNVGNEVLPGYELRYRVRTEAGKNPVFEGWWPQPFSYRWDSDHNGLWDWVLDRQNLNLAPTGKDFGQDGLAMGLHYDPYSPWNSQDDPSWTPSTPQASFIQSRRIPVFDPQGGLLSAWDCVDPVGWVSQAPPDEAPQSTPLHSGAPVVLDGVLGVYSVLPDGAGPWTSTMIGLSPLDGKPMIGVTLKIGSQSWTFEGWWQQISVPNAAHLPLAIEVRSPTSRRIQVQKWEN